MDYKNELLKIIDSIDNEQLILYLYIFIKGKIEAE